MKVRMGWSEDIQGVWNKMDVEVEEEDYRILLAEKDLDTNYLSIKSTEKFRLMYIMAEIFIMIHKITNFPHVYADAEGKAELARLTQNRDKLLESVKERTDDKPPF